MTRGPDALTALEERLAHLLRQAEEMSDELAAQAELIARLEKQVAMLLEREAARAAAEEGGVILGDERPPHY